MDGYSSSFSVNPPYVVPDSADSLRDKGVPVSELQSGGLTPGLKTRYGLVERSIRLEREMRRTPMTFPELLPTMEEQLAETHRRYRPLYRLRRYISPEKERVSRRHCTPLRPREEVMCIGEEGEVRRQEDRLRSDRWCYRPSCHYARQIATLGDNNGTVGHNWWRALGEVVSAHASGDSDDNR